MQPFDYVAPTSLAAATELLKSASSVPTRILAGGTDLLVQMRAGARSTSRVLDIKKIPETSVLEIGTSHLRIGAAISAAQICGHPELRKLFPGVVESIELIGSTQVQGRATPVGNLCNASPGADSVPALVAVGAEARVVSASGERWLPVAELPAVPGRARLGHIPRGPELITAVLRKAGLQHYGRQDVHGVTLLPRECFYPYAWTEAFVPDCVTAQTYGIHHWEGTWCVPETAPLPSPPPTGANP